MARYKYACVNGHEVEVVKAMAEYDRRELCPECLVQMIRVLDVGGVPIMDGSGVVTDEDLP